MKRKSRFAGQLGLTLIELMIVVAILGVVLTLSVPSFTRLQGNYQLGTAAHRLASAINLARSEALARKQAVSLCPVHGKSVCAGDYSRGWAVFSNADRDSLLDPVADELIRRGAGLPGGYTVSNREGTLQATELITYNPDGTARRNQTLLLCGPPGSGSEPRSIVLNLVGRVRVARGEGQCPGSSL